MKRVILPSILVLFFTALSSFSQSDVHYSLGIKYQLVSWDLNQTYYAYMDDFINGVETDMGSELGSYYGPTASFSYQKFGFSITYLMGEWEFPQYPYWYIANMSYLDYDRVTQTTKRSELAFAVSYRVIPPLSVFVGFKTLRLKTEYKYDDLTNFNNEVETTGNGLGGGIAASMPFRPTLHGYVTLGYMSLSGDFETENLIGESGLRQYFASYPVFGSLGYRYESFDGGDTILHGPVLTIMFYK